MGSGKRRIWVFADEGQAFWEKRKIPPAIEKHAVKFDLGWPYRCTPGIQALADAYLGKNRGRNIIHRKELGGCEVARATDLAGRERVVCDTFLRYKGLERPVVIIADIKTEAERYAVRMNIAVSRAFGALRVVVPGSELEKDGILMRIIALAGAS